MSCSTKLLASCTYMYGAHIKTDTQAEETGPSFAERRPPKIASSATLEIDWPGQAAV
ncbi:hypothetical protein JG688_00008374 [Phytophthora aleatoria]|uniref:Uncharacterized protein n=1 Tax=Phytophthora aleatoria TaxID=2496075 RepID=A0A8J5J860_9STRA|nr:hypothetical protein JG688_00008374 [Phytophthora aleatoria]